MTSSRSFARWACFVAAGCICNSVSCGGDEFVAAPPNAGQDSGVDTSAGGSGVGGSAGSDASAVGGMAGFAGTAAIGGAAGASGGSVIGGSAGAAGTAGTSGSSGSSGAGGAGGGGGNCNPGAACLKGLDALKWAYVGTVPKSGAGCPTELNFFEKEALDLILTAQSMCTVTCSLPSGAQCVSEVSCGANCSDTVPDLVTDTCTPAGSQGPCTAKLPTANKPCAASAQTLSPALPSPVAGCLETSSSCAVEEGVCVPIGACVATTDPYAECPVGYKRTEFYWHVDDKRKCLSSLSCTAGCVPGASDAISLYSDSACKDSLGPSTSLPFDGSCAALPEFAALKHSFLPACAEDTITAWATGQVNREAIRVCCKD